MFVDTNVILEAFRTGCWSAICSRYFIETVEKCVEEALTGNPGDPRHIAVPPQALSTGLSGKHHVTPKALASLVITYAPSGALDDGEKHLLAWLQESGLLPSEVIVVSTADKAALVTTHGLGWLDCAVSLEVLARNAGVARATLAALALQYQEDWLVSIKTRIRLGIIP